MADESTRAVNLRLRLAHLGATWEDLARAGGERPGNVRDWVARGNPTMDTLKRLARLLGVPDHALLDPDFNTRDYPPPGGVDGGEDGGQAHRDE
jgi:hypothetical protein